MWMPGPELSEAARIFNRFSVVATEFDLAAGSDPVVYELAELQRLHIGRSVENEDEPPYRLNVRSIREVWRSVNGAVAQERILGAELLTPQDRRIWESLGRPSLPLRGDIVDESDSALPLPDLSDLPREPGALLEEVSQQWTSGQLDTDIELLKAIGELLARGDATPALRADLFRAAAQIPGIDLLGTIRDPLDREGMGIALGPSERRVTLIVDPNTSVLLSVEERFPLMGEIMSEWIAYSEWATVPEIGDRPDGSDVV
jgi:hypothetical protein